MALIDVKLSYHPGSTAADNDDMLLSLCVGSH